ncbi:unnamed protein product [Miscanthus lutarioriparius]|uniref:Uncharacterized protein n=1 Tax=Miscanthus lutarioriparius TaxID=422564 RepID=A0A811PU03_9POAL|nr:unnamed protein product [Miscanthus lutarioriparius]
MAGELGARGGGDHGGRARSSGWRQPRRARGCGDHGGRARWGSSELEEVAAMAGELGARDGGSYGGRGDVATMVGELSGIGGLGAAMATMVGELSAGQLRRAWMWRPWWASSRGCGDLGGELGARRWQPWWASSELWQPWRGMRPWWASSRGCATMVGELGARAMSGELGAQDGGSYGGAGMWRPWWASSRGCGDHGGRARWGSSELEEVAAMAGELGARDGGSYGAGCGDHGGMCGDHGGRALGDVATSVGELGARGGGSHGGRARSSGWRQLRRARGCGDHGGRALGDVATSVGELGARGGGSHGGRARSSEAQLWRARGWQPWWASSRGCGDLGGELGARGGGSHGGRLGAGWRRYRGGDVATMVGELSGMWRPWWVSSELEEVAAMSGELGARDGGSHGGRPRSSGRWRPWRASSELEEVVAVGDVLKDGSRASAGLAQGGGGHSRLGDVLRDGSGKIT